MSANNSTDAPKMRDSVLSSSSQNPLAADAEKQTTSAEANNWNSRGCKLVGFALLVAAVAGIVVACVCGTGNCSSSGDSSCNIDCSDGGKYGYTPEDGPDCWGDCPQWAVCRAGLAQSPIDLQSAEAESLPDVTPLVTVNYDAAQTFRVINNGHSVQLVPSGSVQCNISGLALPGTYIFDQLHFHWADTSSQGSEHLINGRAYPLEVHLVHHNSVFGDFGEAADKAQGLAVLGFMFRISPDDNPEMGKIIDKLDDIKYKEDESSLSGVSLDALLPDTYQEFYRYGGSLTTPPCYESVVWTVFSDNVIEISEAQAEKMRSTLYAGKDENTALLDNTYRPTLPLGERKLYFDSA